MHIPVNATKINIFADANKFKSVKMKQRNIHTFLIIILILACYFLPTKSQRMKRANEEPLQDELINIPIDYDQNEEVQDLTEAVLDNVGQNKETAENTQIQIIQTSRTQVTKVCKCFNYYLLVT